MTPLAHSPILEPIGSAERIKDALRRYTELRNQLLSKDDWQTIVVNGKKREVLKKSGFRKLAMAFSLSTEIVRETRRDFEKYFVYEITCKAIAPNGRYATACASCASDEQEFSHVENDTRAIGQTRATNRAIADLLGEGVSAEEMETPAPPALPASQPSPAVSVDRGPTKVAEVPLTVKQRNFIIGYLERLPLSEHDRNKKIKEVTNMTLREAGNVIQKIIAWQNVPKPKKA